MGIIATITNALYELIGSFRDPDTEINDILADFTGITNRLNAVQAKHEKLEKEALNEIDAIKAEAAQKVAELSIQHNALLAASIRAAEVSKKISALIS
jgi:hypothetical protein